MLEISGDTRCLWLVWVGVGTAITPDDGGWLGHPPIWGGVVYRLLKANLIELLVNHVLLIGFTYEIYIMHRLTILLLYRTQQRVIPRASHLAESLLLQ